MAANNTLVPSVHIDGDKLEKLAKLSVLANTSVSCLVNEAIDDFLSEKSKTYQVDKNINEAGRIEELAVKVALMGMSIDTLQKEVLKLQSGAIIQEPSVDYSNLKEPEPDKPRQYLDLTVFGGELPRNFQLAPNYLRQDGRYFLDNPQFVKDLEEAIFLSPEGRNVAISENLAAKGYKNDIGKNISVYRIKRLREILKMLHDAVDEQKSKADQN
jgi:hypothetical protein